MNLPHQCASYTLMSIAKKFQEFFYGEPQDITFEYMDESCRILTKTVPNVSKLREIINLENLNEEEVRAILEDYYTKNEVNNIKNAIVAMFNSYYDKTDIDEIIAGINEDINDLNSDLTTTNNNLDNINTALDTKIDNVNTNINNRIDAEVADLTNDIDNVESDLNEKIDLVNNTKVMSEETFMALVEMRRNIYAGSGLVSPGGFKETRVSDDVWVYDGSGEFKPNCIEIGGPDENGVVRPPIYNINGYRIVLSGINNSEYGRSTIQLPEPVKITQILDENDYKFDTVNIYTNKDMVYGESSIVDFTDFDLVKDPNFETEEGYNWYITYFGKIEENLIGEYDNIKKRIKLYAPDLSLGQRAIYIFTRYKRTHYLHGLFNRYKYYFTYNIDIEVSKNNLIFSYDDFNRYVIKNFKYKMPIYLRHKNTDMTPYTRPGYTAPYSISTFYLTNVSLKQMKPYWLVNTKNREKNLALSLYLSSSYIANRYMSRKDIVFIEVWKEYIDEKDVVYINGLIQYTGHPDSRIDINKYKRVDWFNDSIIYSAFSDNDLYTRMYGYGYKWSELTDEEKYILITNPNNNIYKKGNRWVQVRARIRVIRGFGNEWVNYGLNKNKKLMYDEHYYIKPKGKLSYLRYEITDEPNDLYGSYFCKNKKDFIYELYKPDNISLPEYSVDNELYMLPLFCIQRRNIYPFSPFYNMDGCGIFYNGGMETYWYNDDVLFNNGKNFYKNEYIAAKDENNNIVQYTDNSYIISGSYLYGKSGRPDGLFSDKIDIRDIKDIRLYSNKYDFKIIYNNLNNIKNRNEYLILFETDRFSSFIYGNYEGYEKSLIYANCTNKIKNTSEYDNNNIDTISKIFLIKSLGYNNINKFDIIDTKYSTDEYRNIFDYNNRYHYKTSSDINNFNNMLSDISKRYFNNYGKDLEYILITYNSMSYPKYLFNKYKTECEIIGDIRRILDKCSYILFNDVYENNNILNPNFENGVDFWGVYYTDPSYGEYTYNQDNNLVNVKSYADNPYIFSTKIHVENTSLQYINDKQYYTYYYTLTVSFRLISGKVTVNFSTYDNIDGDRFSYTYDTADTYNITHTYQRYDQYYNLSFILDPDSEIEIYYANHKFSNIFTGDIKNGTYVCYRDKIYKSLVNRGTISLMEDDEDYTNTDNWLYLTDNLDKGGYPDFWLDGGIWGVPNLVDHDDGPQLPVYKRITNGVGGIKLKRTANKIYQVVAYKENVGYIKCEEVLTYEEVTSGNGNFYYLDKIKNKIYVGFTEMTELDYETILIFVWYETDCMATMPTTDSPVLYKEDIKVANANDNLLEDIINKPFNKNSTADTTSISINNYSIKTNKLNTFMKTINNNTIWHDNPNSTLDYNTKYAVKYMPYLTVKNGQAYLQILFKELKYKLFLDADSEDIYYSEIYDNLKVDNNEEYVFYIKDLISSDIEYLSADVLLWLTSVNLGATLYLKGTNEDGSDFVKLGTLQDYLVYENIDNGMQLIRIPVCRNMRLIYASLELKIKSELYEYIGINMMAVVHPTVPNPPEGYSGTWGDNNKFENINDGIKCIKDEVGNIVMTGMKAIPLPYYIDEDNI